MHQRAINGLTKMAQSPVKLNVYISQKMDIIIVKVTNDSNCSKVSDSVLFQK